MPARVVDGEGIWRSKKLKKMTPAFRGEYANLLSLAEANGVFDCDPGRVWSDVYAFNRPEIDIESVEKILFELEQVDLLRRWKDKDKVWGYWTGIRKSGRLPTGVHLSRYKNLPPEPPNDVLSEGDRSTPSGIEPGLSHDDPPWFGIGLDRYGVGMVREEPNPLHTFLETDGQGEDSVKAEKQIPQSCQTILGVRAETYTDVLNQIKALALRTSNGQVVREFEEWAVENQGDEFRGKPLTAWLRSLDNPYKAEQKKAASDPEVTQLTYELAYLSDNNVTFDNKAKVGLREELDNGTTVDEIVSVFRTDFYPQIKDDEFNLKRGGSLFVQKVGQLVYTYRRKSQERLQEAAAVERKAQSLTEEAEVARRAREAARIKAEEEASEGLPD